MLISKLSLTGLLLEKGEEDLAVLLARSDIAEDIDTDADADALDRIGLDADTMQPLLPAVIARGHDRPRMSERDRGVLAHTVSDRWAKLVTDWLEPR